MQTKFTITGFNDEKYELTPHLSLVEVTDFMGKKMHNLALNFTHIEDGYEMPFANFTLNFGEFISVKNCSYVDTNNCWFSDEIMETGIAMDTGFTKISGFCKYPLWQFKEDFLKAVDGEIYQKYSDEFEEYMKPPEPDEDINEDFNMGM